MAKSVASRLEKYKEETKEKVTVLLEKTFPEKILQLNDLLASERFNPKSLESIHVRFHFTFVLVRDSWLLSCLESYDLHTSGGRFCTICIPGRCINVLQKKNTRNDHHKPVMLVQFWVGGCWCQRHDVIVVLGQNVHSWWSHTSLYGYGGEWQQSLRDWSQSTPPKVDAAFLCCHPTPCI